MLNSQIDIKSSKIDKDLILVTRMISRWDMVKRRPHKAKQSSLDTGGVKLASIIVSTKCFALLRVLLYRPGYEMYQNEIIKATGLSPNTAVPLLKKLTSYGVLKERLVAGTKFYSLTEKNPVIKQLKVLVNVSDVYELSRDLSDDIEVYLFGSAARGEDTEGSDIDLLIITNGDKKTLASLKQKVKDRLTNKLKREVNPVIYTPIEYSNLYNKEKAFYDSIEKDKIRVL